MGADGGHTHALGKPRNALGEFVFTRSYAKWLEDRRRRETWEEAVQRYVDWVAANRPAVPKDILLRIRAAILEQGVLPSLRALWSAGPAADRDNTAIYNCSFLPIDSLRSFSELLFVLMQSTGAGYTVELEFAENLPVVSAPTGEVAHLVVEDTTESWCDSVYTVAVNSWRGIKTEVDYSRVRPKGARLMTKGGRSSGPAPLRRVHEFVWETVSSAPGRRLTTLEVHDVCCVIGDIVAVGDVRKAAMISFSDPSDALMRHAKDFSRGAFPDHRYRSNNSSYWEEKPEREVFEAEWAALVASDSGERGFLISSQEKIQRRGRKFRANPCGEILLGYKKSTDPWTGEGGGGSFCNLSAVVLRPYDTAETVRGKVEIASWIGAIQASFTHFPYLRPAWKEICEEDRLLGVDITGQCDNLTISTDKDLLLSLNALARDTADLACDTLGIRRSAAITCGKPSGNSSQLVDCSSGFHPRYADFYFRHVRVGATDPLFKLARDCGVPCFPENGQGDRAPSEVTTWVMRFPVASPKGAMVRNHETALEQLGRYLTIMRSWCGERGHNQSATIYVHPHEWEGVREWVWQNWDEILGLTFLPHHGGGYKLMPYQEITEGEYHEAMASFPEVNYGALSLYELEDMGQGAVELACTGGSCES